MGLGLVQARQLADKIGITTICKWHGALPHDEALKMIANCDCMLFSSVQEGNPRRCHGGPRAGVPVICHDACGFGVAVDETCGIKVPLVSPSSSRDGSRGSAHSAWNRW